jgi:glycogen(starch) synthase
MTPHYHPIEAGDALWKHVAARGLDAYDSRAVYGRAARVFAVTKLEATLLAERRIAEGPRVRILPNGIDLERWKSPPREDIVRRRLGFDGPYVLYAGRLASNKGLDVLLRAWSSMTPDQKQGSALVLAGADWGVRSALEKTAGSLGIRAEVRFAGHLAEEEYRSAVAHAELLVLPSEWEAFGIVLLEAMAAGRPVVATRVGGVPEVVTDGQDGLLVPYGDTEALASAIARVLGDPDLAGRLRAAGPAKARGYDWHSIVGRLESEYRELLGERSPSRDAPAVAA